MESEKVKEIKKDIEICMKSLNCNGCRHHSQKSGECCSNLTNDILTYINELESENERLKILLAQANAGIVNCSGCKLVELNAVKEFAERLKEHPTMKIYSLHNACERIPKAIDETLKEYEK